RNNQNQTASALPLGRRSRKLAETSLRITTKPQTRDGTKGRRWYGPDPLSAAGNVTIVMHTTTAARNQLNSRGSFGVNNAYIAKSGARHIASKTMFCSKSHR